MSDGRTIWWPKDSGWWRRESIVALGEEFGPAGPAVLDWLSCEAKVQNDGGRVKAGVRTLARGCFVDAETVERVLSRCVTLVTLEDFEENEGRFTCRISGWKKDNDRGSAAYRKALQREKEASSHVLSRPVTFGHAESHREEKSSSLQVENVRDPEHVRLSELLADLIAENGSKRPNDASVRNWVRDVRLMVERDGRTLEGIEAAIRWAQADDFWKGNVLSMGKLRKQYDAMRLQAQRDSKPAEKPKWERAAKVVALGGDHACRDCENPITNYQANNQSGLCDPCYETRFGEAA